MTAPELFIAATNAYKDWWSCGRDFTQHEHLFIAWDKAIEAYYKSANVTRDDAINQVRAGLGMSNA
jgi:hypothetical protein